MLTADEETMTKFYEPWAFVRSSSESLPEVTRSLQPLSQ